MKGRNIAMIIIMAAIIVMASTIISDVQREGLPAEPTVTEMEDPGELQVGVLVPLTGDLASYGADSREGTELALVNFNKYLTDNGEDWRMELVIEDTATDPIVTLEKVQSLNAKGIKYVLGPETSAGVRNIKSYVDSSGMIIISPSSTSPELAIPDNLFRLVPDDTQQGRVIAAIMQETGIKAAIPVYRGDVWGDGLYDSTLESFTEIGGILDEGIRYSPDATDFSTEAKLLSDAVNEYTAQYAEGEVAVIIIGFSEVVHFLNSASTYDNLGSVIWFGSDGSSKNDPVVEDPTAAEFAGDVMLISTQFAASDNEVFDTVTNHMLAITGNVPISYVYSSYDALWILGLTLDRVGYDAPASAVLDALPGVAEEYVGAIGDVSLNEAGDLARADYELWAVADNKWHLYGKYISSSSEIVLSDDFT